MGSGPQNYECDAIDPNNPSGPRVKIVIPHRLFDRYYKYNSVKYENIRCVDWVLKHTERIFVGLRLFSEGGWCYTGKPEQWYERENVVVPFPNHLIFAV